MKNILNRFLSGALVLLLVFSAGMPAGMPARADETASFARELKEGDTGADVLALQQRLQNLGYYPGPLDGVFGPDTTNALTLFQRDNGLLASGMLDEITFRLLFSETAKPFTQQVKEAVDSYMPAQSGMMSGWLPMPLPLPGAFNTNEYNYVQENRFLSTLTSPLSTFAADVDTASYAQLRAMILRGESVPKDSVRIEEMLNYFHYNYRQPENGEPLGVTMELAECPWNKQTWLLLIGLKAKEIPREERPAQNLVFLIDVSGSMDSPDKLPLVKRAFLMLLDELSPTDTVSIVTYASRDEVLLEGSRASEKVRIMEAVENLTAGGMTAGAAGITTAYELAAKHMIPGGNNRVLLATDGDLNIGVSDEGSLARLVEEKKQGGIGLSVLGFGDGNYKDNKLEALADRGDGNYSYIDTIHEARRALVSEIGATFFTVARDVKLQVDFNPAALKGYRLIGYENRLMNAEDFADDTKDGGELGSGHRVTVLYELVPMNSAFDFGGVESRYQAEPQSGETGDELLTLSIRAKAPEGGESQLYTYPLAAGSLGDMGENLRFAAAVAQTGMLLRQSEWKGTASFASTLNLLRACKSVSGDPYKEEFLYLLTLLERASSQSKEEGQ
ncbi:MAG: von Willebrand factor type A domain-containing protein [Eubacteriales bacterium]|nr:von Willebrand factor type A domain-containing protein [Eubacteriales bacterium]